jgi:hypothetical protein
MRKLSRLRDLAISSEEYVFLRTLVVSQTLWAERFTTVPGFGYFIFSSRVASCVHFLVS